MPQTEDFVSMAVPFPRAYILLTALIVANAGVQSAKAGEAGCPYLTDAEVALVGASQSPFTLETEPLPDGAGKLCHSGSLMVIVLQGDDSESR